MYVNYHQDNWVDWLLLAQFALNNQSSSSMEESPFFLNHGHHPHMPHIHNFWIKKEGAAQFSERLCRTMKEAKEAIKWSLRVSGELFNKHVQPTIHFKLNDLVYIEGTNIKTTCPSTKLAQQHYSPFKVLCQIMRHPTNWNYQTHGVSNTPSFTETYSPDTTLDTPHNSSPYHITLHPPLMSRTKKFTMSK